MQSTTDSASATRGVYEDYCAGGLSGEVALIVASAVSEPQITGAVHILCAVHIL